MGFLWKGQDQVDGGKCLIIGQGFLGLICRPLVGLSNYKGYGQKEIEPSRPWARLQVQVHQNAKALFAMATVMLVGNSFHRQTIRIGTTTRCIGS
jgi:hypothetical protein